MALCNLQVSPVATAQKPGTIVASGTTNTYELGKKLPMVEVEIRVETGETFTESSDERGKFEFELKYDGIYTLKFSKEGYVSKI